MGNLAMFSLRNRALIALITVFVAVFGAISMTSLKQELFPNIEFPMVGVVVPYAGASPDAVEQQIAEPVEVALKGIDGIERLTSTSASGSATVLVEFKYGTDMDWAKQKAEAAVTGLQTLPEDAGKPIVFAGDINQFPIVQLSVTSKLPPAKLADAVDRLAVPRLEDIEGVRQVQMVGAPVNRVELTLKPRAASLGVTPASIKDGLAANGRLAPVGTVDTGDRTLSVQVGRTPSTVEELLQVAVPTDQKLPGAMTGAVRLSEVATAAEVEVAPTTYSRMNGHEAISLAITKVPDGNTVRVSDAIKDLLPELQTKLGSDTTFTVAMDQAPYITKSVEDLAVEGGLGLVMAIVVILVFLVSLRSTLVTALSIPLSLLVALIGLRVGGYTLNMFTLGALTVAIGRVVDDSIVVVENIKRHLSYGEEKRSAIITAVREVGGAITSSTVATAAVFVPIGLVGGVVGELLRPFAFTVALALLASLLVSLTIVPVLAYWFLPSGHPDAVQDTTQIERDAAAKEARSLLRRIYDPALRFTLRRPWTLVAIALVIFVGTLGMAASGAVKTNFLGNQDENTVTITQELEPGTSLAAADADARAVETLLGQVEGVKNVQTSVGASGIEALFVGGTSNFAVTFSDGADSAAVTDAIEKKLATAPGDITVGGGGSSGFSSALEIVVTAATDADRQRAADEVTEAIRDIRDIGKVTNDAAPAQPVLQVSENVAGAAAGITNQTLAGLLYPTLNHPALDTITVEGQRLDVVMAKPEGTVVDTVEGLRQLRLGTVPLDQAADVKQVDVATGIKRINGERTITVTAEPDPNDLGTVTGKVTKAIDGLDLPPGAEAKIGGVAQDQAEAFSQLGLALLVAIAIVYAVMVATFRSLAQPLILLVSVPFAATGAILMLAITQIPLGVVGLIGALMLIGIVVTNAIVLIDLVNQARDRGDTLVESIKHGGDKRVRPIVMTALATILALTPMSLGLTGGSAFISQPLAIVVIGGLFTSTVLTLLLVPALYLLMERGKEKRARKRSSKRAARAVAAQN